MDNRRSIPRSVRAAAFLLAGAVLGLSIPAVARTVVGALLGRPGATLVLLIATSALSLRARLFAVRSAGRLAGAR